ncbi:RagB/SusD family nutrient uptake outer membrane protein [Cytophagales bacterium LB-30]|uniref:RagB/SusD family nutrient uptake outer membrane protein n=1 Tax=Shiella aurantiaca TaxID=3058365 RepID=A0ABT8F173_9BACT|nr:RagB/SusD family nutrient uptake outer membrane protein [Shiella aurantiaca]MDN4164104.1 RagB/SusD family nutrient uptake outer membrane protein [Shiella aurantiaca]
MKKLVIFLLFLLPLAACTDLDLKPKDGDVDAVVFRDPEAYRSYLAKVYAAFSHTGQQGPAGRPDISIVPDEGFTSYIRAYWKAQELTTDEAVIAWTDAGIRDMNDHNWSSENQFVRVVYYRIFYIIAYANDFLAQSTDAKLEANGISAADRAVIQLYRAEARFLRALAYWHALDLFRNVPILTAISTELPVQGSPEELFSFIEGELNAIESVMADPRTNEYGRADKAAVWMLQAKLYLNAQAQIGVDRYSDAATAAKKVIDAGYSLAANYPELFMADNDKERDTELIFTLPADGIDAQNWGSTTFLVHGAIGGSMVDADYGVSGAWAGMRTTSAMVAKFSGATVPVAQDPRAIFYTDGQSLEITDIGTFTDGYAVPKFTNKTSAGGDGSNNTWCDTDYPMFRLADAYLIYAEAVLRGGTGSVGDAVGYINLLRERAYGNNSANITQAQLTLDFVLDERVRELYWEGTRRIDLIRYGRFTDQGIWPWKGGVAEGRLTESWRNIFPIPSSDLIANPRLKQNPEY